MTFFQTLALTDFDIVVILLTVFSIIIGFIRGFSREVLSITSWVGSILIALHLRPIAVPFVKQHITASFFAEPIGIFIVFFLCFAILAKTSQIISKSIKSSVVGIIDRFMGVCFGIVRAGGVFGVAYMLYSTLTSQSSEQSGFLAHSKTLPIIKASVTLVEILLPQDVVNSGQKQFEGWVDHQLKSPNKSTQSPEQWPKDSHTPETQPQPLEKNEESKIKDTKILVENLSKIHINSQSKPPEVSSIQKEKLNRVLESY